MKIINKEYTIDKPDNITVEHIENIILDSGYTPLRWAIIKSDNNQLIIDAVIINKKRAVN